MGTHPIFESDFDCLTELRMKLFCVVLAGLVLAKTPHSKKDFDEMDEEEHKKLDQDVFNFDPDEFDEDWDPWDLEEDEIKARLTKVFKKIDTNGDSVVDRSELIAHTYKALYSMDEVEAEEEFIEADQDADELVSWSEFVFEFYGLEQEDENNILEMDTDTGTEFNRMYARDKGRFHAADADADGKLNLMEFQAFKNPLKTSTLRELAIEWAMRDVDKNGDGKISMDEYMADYMTKPERIWSITERSFWRKKNTDSTTTLTETETDSSPSPKSWKITTCGWIRTRPRLASSCTSSTTNCSCSDSNCDVTLT